MLLRLFAPDAAHPDAAHIGALQPTRDPLWGVTVDSGMLTSIPVILVVAAACAILIVLALDVRTLRRQGRLTTLHAVAVIVLAATVVSLTVGFAMGVANVPRASAETDLPGPVLPGPVLPGAGSPDTAEDPLAGFQLPTLAGD